MSNSNVNNFDLDKMSADKKPDVILVKKQFGDKGFRNRQRKWKLQRLEREAAMSADSNERFALIAFSNCRLWRLGGRWKLILLI